MALKLGSLKGTFSVIISKDPALADDLTQDEYAEYLKSFESGDGNESLLRFQRNDDSGLFYEPTRFIMSRLVAYDKTIELQDMSVTYNKGEMAVKMGFMIEEVRCSLVGIKNPDSIPEDDRIIWKKDSDGFTSKELMTHLVQAKWHMDLWGARNKAVGDKTLPPAIKKK